VRALRDGEQRAHAEVAHRVAAEDVAFGLREAVGELLRLLRQVARIADVRRQVAEFARERDARGDRLALRERVRMRPPAIAMAFRPVSSRRLFFAPSVAVGVSVARVGGGDDGLADVPGGIAVLGPAVPSA
jgi:hypothetical protein